MFKRYKKLYESELLKRKHLENTLNEENENYRKNIALYEAALKDEKEYEEHFKQKLFSQTIRAEKLEISLEYCKKQKRLLASSKGGLNAKIKRLENENKEMMNLINNLITERQRLLREKKRPTINEMKKYFKN